jgi:putative ABC transport system permease protein
MIRHIFTLIWNRKRTNLLMMAEIFVSFLVLFVVVALAVYAADNWRRPIGFTYDRVWDVGIDMKQVNDDDFSPAQQQTLTQLLLALKEFPEIDHYGGAMLPPYSPFESSTKDFGWHDQMIEASVSEVTDGVKDVLGLQVQEGRWFGPEDDGQAYIPVVINKDLRETLFGTGQAIGKSLTPDRNPDGSNPGKEERVVGVLAAYREDGEFDGSRNYIIYRKNLMGGTERQDRPPRNLLVKVRAGTTAEFEERLIKRLQRVAPEWSFEVTTLPEMRASAIRFAMAPLAAVGLVAAFLMVMVGLGLLGVLWQNVTQRTREIGLRRAKGATRTNVRRQILGEIAAMSTLALAVGLLVAVQLPLLHMIYFVEPHVYAISLAISVAAIYLLTLACGWYPSRMATTVDPADALRYE